MTTTLEIAATVATELTVRVENKLVSKSDWQSRMDAVSKILAGALRREQNRDACPVHTQASRGCIPVLSQDLWQGESANELIR